MLSCIDECRVIWYWWLMRLRDSLMKESEWKHYDRELLEKWNVIRAKSQLLFLFPNFCHGDSCLETNPVGNLLSDVWTHWLIFRCNTGCSFVVSFNSQTSKKTMTQWIQTIPEVLKDRCRPQGMELPGWIPDRCDPRDQDQWITQVRHSGYISYIYKLGPVNHPGGKTFSMQLIIWPN